MGKVIKIQRPIASLSEKMRPCRLRSASDFHGSRAPSGFTLIEILIALVILSISLLALASLMATTTKNNASGGHVTEAATFAQDRLEELRATRWDNIVTGQDQRVGSTGVTYTRNWNVAVGGNIRTITVRVSWTDRNSHSISLLSLISQ